MTTQNAQVPALTTLVVPVTGPNGIITNAQTVFSQAFSSVPSQGPSATAGSVGLGSIGGTVGAPKTPAPKSAGHRLHATLNVVAAAALALMLTPAM